MNLTPWRKRSGNGTRAAQDLYVMVNLPFLWAWKVGISRDAYERAIQNSRSVPGLYVVVAVVRLPFAYQLEQFLLKATRWAQCSVFGKGGREVRWFFIGLPVAVLVWCLSLCKWLFYIILVAAVCWIAAGKPAL